MMGLTQVILLKIIWRHSYEEIIVHSFVIILIKRCTINGCPCPGIRTRVEQKESVEEKDTDKKKRERPRSI